MSESLTNPPSLPVAWVIGATSGIGHALATRLSTTTQLVLSARSAEPLAATAQTLGAMAVPLDATQPDSIQQALAQIIATYGRVDYVVLAVG
ncbi:MAG: SDR family NAD(P)-dependent oxidoreductase, partial [Roseiflexaceae bacterium]